MHHNALRRRVWDSSVARRWVNMPVGQGIRLTTTLKPPYAGAVRPHPVMKSTASHLMWGRGGKMLMGPEGLKSLLSTLFLTLF